jgi:phospholipid/cholesterol/gamma-HCH transport system ATP-binding protein
MLEPDLLFLRRAVAGLDPITAVELDDLIVSLSRDLGITVVIRDARTAQHLFSLPMNCIVLDKEAKGIVATGPPARLREESTIPFVHHFLHANRRPARQQPRGR